MRGELVAALLAAAAVAWWPRVGLARPARVAVFRSARQPGWRPARRRRVRAHEGELAAELAELLAPALAAGVPPHHALRAALEALPAEFGGLLPRVLAAADHGDQISAALAAEAVATGRADLAALGRGFALTEAVGAPLAPAVTAVAGLLRDRAVAAQRAQVAAAGPRATMWLLVLLPVCGPLVGLVFGLNPTALYAASPASGASLAAGLGLAALGWWWSRTILARGTRAEPAR